MTIEEKDLAWAAGFFDGEGYITIGRRNWRGYTGHYLRVGINHVAPEPIYKFKALFGGKIEYTENVVGNRKPRYRWIISTSSAGKVLQVLLPFLVNKNKEAALAIEFQDSIDPNNSKTITKEVTEYRESCKQKLMVLNASC